MKYQGNIKKILLIQPPWYCLQGILSQNIHLGVCYIGAVLEQDGYNVKIINGETSFVSHYQNEKISIDLEHYFNRLRPDFDAFQCIFKYVDDFDPDVIGMSFLSPASGAAYITSNGIKDKYPDKILIAGGVHATIIADDVILNGKFDFAVRGEGEETIKELIKVLSAGEDYQYLKGISYRHNGKVCHNQHRDMIKNLDDVPFPAYHLIHNFNNISVRDTIGGIITSRGCPFKCNYCATSSLWSRKVRFRSGENIIEELQYHKKHYNLSRTRFQDDTFTLNHENVRKICNKLRLLKIKWSCDTTINCLSKDLMGAMKMAGCYQINIGIESGNREIQKAIRKNLDFDLLEKIVKVAQKAGIIVLGYFLIGFPDETEDMVNDTINLMRKIKVDVPLWSILTIYPGTEMWTLAEQKGILPGKIDWSKHFHHTSYIRLSDKISDKRYKEILLNLEKEIERDYFNLTKRVYRLYKSYSIREILFLLYKKFKVHFPKH
jgi:radical SAM superfamily enzyme YgiQ (UPF0313 family)